MEGQLKTDKKNPDAREKVIGCVAEDKTSQTSKSNITTRKNEKYSTASTDSTVQSSTYSTADEDPHDAKSALCRTAESFEVNGSGENVSTDQLSARIRQLEDVLAGKEAALLAVTQELEAVREMSCIDASIGPLSSGFDVDIKTTIAEYNRKIQKHASALRQRDEYINKLADSLKQSVRDREELKQEARQLSEQVHLLKTQLQTVKQQMHQPQTKLLDALKEMEAQLQKKTAELSNSKAKSAKEVQFLMSSLEELQQRAARSASASPPMKEESNQKLLNDLRIQYDSEKKLLLKQIAEAQEIENSLRKQLLASQKECENLTLELSSLKLAHETQLDVCRDHHELVSSESKIEECDSLKEKLILAQKQLQESIKQTSELENEIQVLRSQLYDSNEVCKKQGENIQLLQCQTQEYAADIATCHQTLEQYKKRIDELQAKHSEDMGRVEANHSTEVVSINQRVSDLQEAHAKQLHSMHQDLNRMKQRQMEELTMKQLSHENELNTSKRENERYRTELREKNNLVNIQEQQLEEERQWSKKYSQQVQELGEKLSVQEDKNEEYREKIECLQQELKEIDQTCNLYQPQIEFLHQQLKDERQKSTNILQQLEDVRKQLLQEQERCKAYSLNLEDANSNIQHLQVKNSEIQAQALKLDESLKLISQTDDQKIYSLQSEILQLREQLSNEKSQVDSLRVETEALNEQLKSLSSLQKDFQNLQGVLENERQTSSKYKTEILNLEDELCQQKIRFEEDYKKLLSQVQKCNVSIDNLEGNGKEPISRGGDVSTKDTSPDRKQLQEATMQLKVKVLEETNMNLRREREESEAQMETLKEQFRLAKEDFENSSRMLKDEVDRKDLEILELQKLNFEVSKQKSEIESYNLKVKELLSAKTALAEELSEQKEKYAEEILLLKDQVSKLQQNLGSSIQSSKDEAINISLKKCRDDMQLVCSANTEEDATSGKPYESTLDSFTLEKLVNLCKEVSNEKQNGDVMESILFQLTKLSDTNEKLETELDKCNNQYISLQKEYDNLLSQLETSGEKKQITEVTEGGKFLQSSPSDEKGKLISRTSKISEAIAYWFKRCEELEKNNLELKITAEELQAKLSDCDDKTNFNHFQIQSVDVMKARCTCETIFSKERNMLKHSIEMLQKELVDKELHYEDKMKSILRKNKSFAQPCADIGSVTNLINHFSRVSKEKIMLENDLRNTKLESGLNVFENNRLAEHAERTKTLLEESWKEQITLASDLHNALKENSIVRARLMRLETIYESTKPKSSAHSDLVWQLIGELSSASVDKKHPEGNSNKPSILEKVESVIKIICKMSSDCETLMVKLQRDEDKTLCGYLQSEALGLRRLQSALGEIQQTIESKSEPALLLHVELLNAQLKDKQVAYQDICEAHYSLEAEMREMETRSQQQEQHLEKELCKQKALYKLLKLKAEASQVLASASQTSNLRHHENLSKILEEMDSVYSQAFVAWHTETERIVMLRENKVRFEMSEKLCSAEKRFKEQYDEIEKKIKSDSNVKALQVLHQQEIDAVRAECDLTHIKAMHKFLEEMPSFLTKPPAIGPNLSSSNLSLLFMKHHISTQYQNVVQKLSTSLQNELGQHLSLLPDSLELSCTSNDTEFDIPVPDANFLAQFELIVSNAQDLGGKLLEMQRSGLDSILSACESNHKLILEKVQEMAKELGAVCAIKSQCDELVRAKEEHRLTVESMSTSHKAEVSRLRLLLSQQNVGETSEPNETALSVLQRELEDKHKKQMEELRTYFEQKCADFEKHYSEEVFSQHSRKLSDCSSASESELVSEMYYAGPGSSNCSLPGAPTHFCDLLGESSFKDLEEHTRTVNVQKLFLENREQLETLRLALESRHQGELEAQKELFEGKLQELLNNMSDSYAAELKLQSSCLQDMKEKEAELNKKLLEAEKTIENLKQQLSLLQKDFKSSGQQEFDPVKEQPLHFYEKNVKRLDKETQSEFEDESRKLSDILKRRNSESSAQIATLKIKLRQNQEVMSKLEKDLSNLRAKYESDVQSLTISNNEKTGKIEKLNSKIQELTSCLEEAASNNKNAESQYARLKEEFESQLQSKEKEFESKINELKQASNCLRDANKIEEEKNLQEKMNRSVEETKFLLEAEYTEYLEFVKKCADETKEQLVKKHENEMKQVIDKYEKELTSVRNSAKNCGVAEVKSIPTSLESDHSDKESLLQPCLQELLKLTKELEGDQQDRFEKNVLKLCKEVDHYQQILHQDLEMKLESVRTECERRFQLQLVEARGDIVQALEKQIQLLLDDSTCADEKPPELQQLEKKLATKYNEKLINMQRDYETKISELCSKHATQLSLARNKRPSKVSTITAEDLDKLYKERDCLRSVAATLRDVVAELVRYFVSWEDDFNNTLMDELVKLEAGRDDGNDMLSVTQQDNSAILNQSQDSDHRRSVTSEDEMPVIVATPARGRPLSSCVKRVHFAPDVSGILSLIDDGSLFESVGLNCSMRDTSLNLQEELDRCLSRLRSDSAALYALSKPALPSPSSEQSFVNVSNNESSSGDLSGKLSDALQTIAKLQKEKEELSSHLKMLYEEQEKSFAELQATRQRLDSLEQEALQQAEVVAEGYGEGEQSMTCDIPSSPRATTVEELQNKARSLLLGISNTEEISGVLSPNSSQHLPHIVEELCRDWERLAEESRHKQEDLQQQVEAVDKQLRATRAFMDEQAAEREQERDDYVEEIRRLQELLRDKDRDRNSHQLMNHEVESLEVQLKESQAVIQDRQEKLDKLNAEHKQAVEKIWTLRDIISDLEVQVASKAEEAATVAAQNDALRQMVEQQGRTQLELAQEMEQLQHCTNDGTLLERISQLEEQLSKHQTLVEQLGDSSFIEQMKTQLQDLNASLDLHTRELECAYINSTLPASPCLSSPSEDVSVRETIEALRAAAEKDAPKQTDSCLVLPFTEVSKVMDQWQRHARADDSVLKKIRELDMQVDDLTAEKETLVNRLQDQMLLSSSLQAKLEDHRRKADIKLSEASSEMQGQIEDLRSEIQSYSETLEAREKQIENLKVSLCRVENELRSRDAEIKNTAELERNIATQLQSQISKLSADKSKLQAVLLEKDDMHVSIPALVESMLLDKNADIDRLEQQVHHLTKQMELSSHYVVTPSTTLEFEYCESEKVRAHVALSPVMELRRSLPMPIINESTLGKNVSHPSDTPVSFITHQTSLENNGGDLRQETEVSLKPVPLEDSLSQTQSSMQSQQNSNSLNASDILSSTSGSFDTSLASCEKLVANLEQQLEAKTKEIDVLLKKLNDTDNIISEMGQKCKKLEDCEQKLMEMSKLESELLFLRKEQHNLKKLYEDKVHEVENLKGQLKTIQIDNLKHQDKNEEVSSPEKPDQDTSELRAKESEIQRLRNEVCATQAILTNLQRKVQEAKQIARSPSRSSPDNNQALRVVQNELEAAKLEIVDLKDLCRSIKSEMEEEYQLKQSDFEKILHREQEAKQSLLITLDKLQQENSATNLNKIETDLKEAKANILEKEMENRKLHTELNQINMECIALKNQLSTPIKEATTLACKLEAEKKFSEALKEELLLFKNQAASLDEECRSLKAQVQNVQEIHKIRHTKENEQCLKEISELKRSVDDLLQERSSLLKQIEEISHDNAVLREENFEVCKELSDMKQLIIEMRWVKASREETEKTLLSKNNEICELKRQKSALSEELFSLRKAVKNIHSNMHNSSGLAEEDRLALHKLQRQVQRPDLAGAGDGPRNKLTLTEIDIHEIPSNSGSLKESESLDDLTGLVQHELNVSVQLDHSLLQTMDPCSSKTVSSVSVVKSVPPENDLSERSFICAQPRLTQEEISAQQRIGQLEDELNKMRDVFQSLNSQLATERAQYLSLQQQDCKLIEEMRVKLSEALDGQNSLRLQLQSELMKRRSSDLNEAQEPVRRNPSPTDHSSVVTENLQKQHYEARSELLKLRIEKEAAEKQLRRMQEVEIQRSHRRAATEEKHRRKIDQLQTLHAETQQECTMLRQELAAVNQKLQLAQEEFAKDRDSQLKNHAPFVERLKNMNTFLEEHIEENIRMAKQMEDLTEEHKKLRRRIAQLEGQLAEKRSNESFDAANARFAAEKAEWEAEQKVLLLALSEAKQKQRLCSESDIEDRVSHLFGRYLRMQSYRKALVWQKRYLLSVISGLNEPKSLTSNHLANLTENNKVLNHNPRRRFRSAVMVMLAVHRMQFMVERWFRGKRIGCGVVVQQTVSHCAFSTSSIPQGQSSLFPSTQMTADDRRSGLSQSPPTLERPRQPRSQHFTNSQFSRLSLNRDPSSSLSECVSNFNLVQQRFDALLLNPPK